MAAEMISEIRMMGTWTMEHRRRMGPGFRTMSWMGSMIRQRLRLGSDRRKTRGMGAIKHRMGLRPEKSKLIEV